MHGGFCQPVTTNKIRNEYRFKFKHLIKGEPMAVVGAVQMDGDGGIFVITVEFIK